MPAPLDLLTSEQIAQLTEMRESFRGRSYPDKRTQTLAFALEDAISGALSIAGGSLGLAPRCLKDASEGARKAAMMD